MGLDPHMDPEHHQLTQRDLDYTPDDGNLYEVIDGELFVTPFPGYAHQQVVSELFFRLSVHVRERRLGSVFSSGLKVVLDEPSGVGPDLVYISAENMANMREDGFYGAPDLVIEVTSTKPQLDRYVKFNKYARSGIPNYWLVDPERRKVEAFALAGDRYRRVAELERTGEFQPALFPGLSIDVETLFPV